jgi:uncharacterized protein YdeI (YjbR/CyaY-like superfamily)
MSDALPVLTFADAQEFEAWLEANHESQGLWVKVARKGSGIPSVHPPEALDVALSFGWIDGLRRRHDDTYYLQRYSPRAKRSKWSKINVAKAQELIASGKMRPQGLAEVERAQADGRWDAAYDSPSRIGVPPDLQAELDKDADAAAYFAQLPSQHRYHILYQLHDAKRPETRARRLAGFVSKLKRRELLP